MRVKFLDLKPNSKLQTELDEAYRRVMSSGQYIGGDEVLTFEKEWADYYQSACCVSCSSGQAALELLLRAFGVGHGDRVIVPSWTASPTWKAVLKTGAIPVPVEANPDTFLVESYPSLKNIKAIIPVSLYGYNAPLPDCKVPIIEDRCQAHGLTRFRDAAFSFYPTKNLGGYGDGGAIVTNNKSIAAACKKYRDSNRLDPLQAAFLRVKLQYLDEYTQTRQNNARLYHSLLCDKVIKPPLSGVFHQYVIRAENRDQLKAALKIRGIETMVHYPIPPHRELGFDFSLPIADRLAATVLSLPIMTSKKNVEIVAEAINGYLSSSN